MDNNSIDKYIQRLEQLQNLYKKGEGQHNAFGIAINEAKEMLVSKNESLHLVGVREFECDDIVCTKDGRIWMITEIDGDDVYACGNGKKYYPLEKSEITHAH